MLRTFAGWLRRLGFRSTPIIICTVLTALSALCWVLFSNGVFADRGMQFFETVGLPMQLAVIIMGIFLMVRVQRNRPRSFIQSVPRTVRIVVPLAIALGAVQLTRIPSLVPATTPGGGPVHSFDAGIKNGVCVALFNQTERVVQPFRYCEQYQAGFNRTFAAAWLLFSAIELWGAWAIYGAEPVRRVQPDRQMVGSVSVDRRVPPLSAMRSRNAYLWLTIRLAILAFWTVGGWFGFRETIPAPAFILVVTLLFTLLSTRYAVVQEYTDVDRTEPWFMPSWFLNPFQRSQPFQFFHLAGLSFLLFGCVGIAHASIGGARFSFEAWPAEALAAAFGLGILLGISWATRAYRSRFQQVTVP